MDLKKLVGSPVRIQVIQYLAQAGEATTKQIAQAMADVPQPTLYRNINALLKDGLLSVKEERKVRGSVERLLVLRMEGLSDLGGASIADTAWQFFMGLYAGFQKYASTPGADPERDMLLLSTCSMKLTDEAYAALLTELGGLMQKYREGEDRQNGRARSLSVVSAPAFEE